MKRLNRTEHQAKPIRGQRAAARQGRKGNAMKTQKYISYQIDGDGKAVNFDRWSCARVETIIKAYREAYETSSLFKMLYHKQNTARIDIYRTPDGYNKENEPCFSFSL
jgi:hypothetical protein